MENMMTSKYAQKFTELCSNFEKKSSTLLLTCEKKLDEIEKIIEKQKTATNDIDNTKDLLEEKKNIAENQLSEVKKIISCVENVYKDVRDSQDKITQIYTEMVKLDAYVYGDEKEILSPVTYAEFTELDDEEKIQKEGKYFAKKIQNITGKKEEIEKLIKNISESLEKEKQNIVEHDKSIEVETQKLYKKIEGLLPGATAAGLTTAYEEARNKTENVISFWRKSFIASLILIAVIIFYLLHSGIISFSGDLSFEKTLVQILKLLGCEFPCIWFAWTSNIKISQYTRLLEEYRHKWSMAKTFEGMRKAIVNAENLSNEHREKFYNAMLSAFSDNPSKIFDKKYEPDGPISITSKLANKIPSFNRKRNSKDE